MNIKRTLAMVLSLCMIISGIQIPLGISVSADPADEVTLTPAPLYYNIDGTPIAAVSGQEPDNWKIRLSKTAEYKPDASSEGRGHYEVSLQADIQDYIEPVKTNVVLLIDGSSSMNYCTSNATGHLSTGGGEGSKHSGSVWCGGVIDGKDERTRTRAVGLLRKNAYKMHMPS